VPSEELRETRMKLMIAETRISTLEDMASRSAALSEALRHPVPVKPPLASACCQCRAADPCTGGACRSRTSVWEGA
jgi:hypothetical protein